MLQPCPPHQQTVPERPLSQGRLSYQGGVFWLVHPPLEPDTVSPAPPGRANPRRGTNPCSAGGGRPCTPALGMLQKGLCALLCSDLPFCTSAPAQPNAPNLFSQNLPAAFITPRPCSSGERAKSHLLPDLCLPAPTSILQYFGCVFTSTLGQGSTDELRCFSHNVHLHFHVHEPADEQNRLNAKAGSRYKDGKTLPQ